LLISAVLLLRFAVDFSGQGLRLAVPFWGLVALTLTVMAANNLSGRPTRGGDDDKDKARRAEAWLLSLIPVGFFASSLDCTGLSLRGCSTFCTFIKLIWIPLVGAVCVGYYLRRDRRGPAVLLLLSFVPLIPHCICYNVANAWWIDHIGASPECYGWGFVVSTLTVGALAVGKRYLVTIIVNSLIVTGSLGFFVAHHYFGFPW
jgi:hypothetical protein